MPGDITPPLPPLPTLELQPSWVNRAGRVDRSACVELRVSDLWRLAEFTTICRRSASKGSYLEARATIAISARWLHQQHINRNPLALQGDWRTSKANALRSKASRHLGIGASRGELGGGVAGDGWRVAGGREDGAARKVKDLTPDTRHLTPVSGGSYDERYPYDARAQWEAYVRHDGAFLRDHPLPAINPNRGAPFSDGGKQIGLTHDWKQELVIERWRINERLGKHYLVCPGRQRVGIEAARHQGIEERKDGIEASGHRGNESCPPLDASMPRCHDASLCCLKAAKLFTPVCSIQEGNDAGFAEGWILLTDARYAAAGKPMPRDVMEMRGKLLERYGVLFQGRRLVCRKCLGVRYGEVRKPKRAEEDSPRRHGERGG